MSYTSASPINFCSGSTYSGEFVKTPLEELFEQRRDAITERLGPQHRNSWIVFEWTTDSMDTIRTFTTRSDAEEYKRSLSKLTSSLVVQPNRHAVPW